MLYYFRKVGFDKSNSNEQFIADVCASFQSAVVDVLIDKLIMAAKRYSVKDIAVSGGVSANSELRRRLEAEAKINHFDLFIPKIDFCTDNGAMVAIAGYERLRQGFESSLELTADSENETHQVAYCGIINCVSSEVKKSVSFHVCSFRF